MYTEWLSWYQSVFGWVTNSKGCAPLYWCLNIAILQWQRVPVDTENKMSWSVFSSFLCQKCSQQRIFNCNCDVTTVMWQVKLMHCQVEKVDTFLDYIRGGYDLFVQSFHKLTPHSQFSLILSSSLVTEKEVLYFQGSFKLCWSRVHYFASWMMWPIYRVAQCWAWLVLGWVTARNDWVNILWTVYLFTVST
jgi:hypothetical protein